MDDGRLTEFLQRLVGDLGATVAAGNVVAGARLGLYRALALQPLQPDELARRTGIALRYVGEWLRAQAAGGYVQCDAESGTYWLTEEQAFALTQPDGPVYVPSAFQLAAGTLQSEQRIMAAFRSGDGVGWNEHDSASPDCTRIFRAGQVGSLVRSWLPALDGVEAKLLAGARVADIGCGHGDSTVLMARAYPESVFVGSDHHAASISHARASADAAGVSGRVSFEVATVADFGGGPYDLVAAFDRLHDLGDPLRAARHVLESLRPDGTWMIVEPYAGDTVSDNMNPVGRAYYSISSLFCVPNALSEEGGYSLGAQAGEAVVRRLVAAAGFRHFRRAAETPFNLVFEARP